MRYGLLVLLMACASPAGDQANDVVVTLDSGAAQPACEDGGHGPDPSWVVVDSTGDGDFTTLQGAIDAHDTPGPNGWRRILVRDGTYTERVLVPEASGKLLIAGESRDGVTIQLDECYTNPQGRWQARPVVTIEADDVVLSNLTVHNLAGEPGGCDGVWDHAVWSHYADRVALVGVTMRADHDTLLVYGVRLRVYVTGSHILGRGDMIASFSSTFIEDSVLETIRDRGHFLFQRGEDNTPPHAQEKLVVKDSVFQGQTIDQVWPFGVANLSYNSIVYLIGNTFHDNIGSNRPVLHYNEQEYSTNALVYRHGNQFTGPGPLLIWNVYTHVGPPGVPMVFVPIDGPPYAHELNPIDADRVQPDVCFWGWDARAAIAEARQVE